MVFKDHILLNDLRLPVFLARDKSIFRHYQDLFLETYGADIVGDVIEIGGERSYRHERFFPRASRFRCTNIARDRDEYLDVTRMSLADRSVDAFVCVSVLEHVYEIQTAIAEIRRTLRPGGKLLLVIPFGFPYHDEVDYWRLSADAYPRLLSGFDIDSFVHLGGLFSTIIDNLKRPKGAFSKRYLVHKLIGASLIMFARFERLDGMPLGYGISATRRHDE